MTIDHYCLLQELDLLAYGKLVCALLDVPVYDNVIDSLHVVFSLFLAFKQNPFFMHVGRPESSMQVISN